jgi:hypothetical protein
MAENASSMRSNASGATNDTAACKRCGVRFLRRRSWQEFCSDRCRREAHLAKQQAPVPQPVRLAIKEAIRLLDREASLRRLSIEGGWQPIEEHARVLRGYIGEPAA